MESFDMFSWRAEMIAARSRAFMEGAGWPIFAATLISRASLENSFDFWASCPPFRCLIFLNWECPPTRFLFWFVPFFSRAQNTPSHAAPRARRVPGRPHAPQPPASLTGPTTDAQTPAANGAGAADGSPNQAQDKAAAARGAASAVEQPCPDS